MDNLKEKTAKGLFWGALNNGTMQILNVIIGILLGRMLTPEEWAPIGMIAIFSAIAGNLQSSGFSTAIINMKQPTDNDYNAVFWFNTITSFCIYILLFAIAPWIAVFFEQPCLTDLSARDDHRQPYRSRHLWHYRHHPGLQRLFLLESGLATGCQFYDAHHWQVVFRQMASLAED